MIARYQSIYEGFEDSIKNLKKFKNFAGDYENLNLNMVPLIFNE